MALIHGRAAGRPPLNLRGLFDRCRKNGPRCAACSNWLGEGGRPGWHIPPPRRKAAEKSPRMETEQSYLTRSVVCRTYFGTISEFGRSTLNILPVHFTAHRA
jgi:hypothetical protein